MIERAFYKKYIEKALGRSRAVSLLGPRPCGKTTIARQIVDIHSPNYLDLEDPSAFIGLEDPKTAIEQLKGVEQIPRFFHFVVTFSLGIPLSPALVLGVLSICLQQAGLSPRHRPRRHKTIVSQWLAMGFLLPLWGGVLK